MLFVITNLVGASLRTNSEGTKMTHDDVMVKVKVDWSEANPEGKQQDSIQWIK